MELFAPIMTVSSQFKSAITLFATKIHSVYKAHEVNFDMESFHGRFHIIRCLLLADCIYRFYERNSIAIAIEKSFYAILFHDAMREDNGIDLWEQESATLCYTYLINNGFDAEFATSASTIILKANTNCLEEQVLYDVDVLDYHRFFFLPEGRHRFKDYRLKFAGPNDCSGCFDTNSRTQLIQLAQDLVIFSDTLVVETDTNELIQQLVRYYLNVKPW